MVDSESSRVEILREMCGAFIRSIYERGNKMEYIKFKPMYDKFFFWIWIPTFLLMSVCTALAAMAPVALVIMILCDLFCIYFFVSPLFGYVELRRDTMFIKFGFFLTREIPYSQIHKLS